jgi:hypothetical protein
MIVPGLSGPGYDDPAQWEMWVRYYKGWSHDEWLAYYNNWMSKDDAGRGALMRDTGVHYYRWANDDSGTPVNDAAVAELARQMAGMQDITLIGHSKGANLIENYLAAQHPGTSQTNKIILLKAPNGAYITGSGSREPGGPFETINTCDAYHDACRPVGRQYTGSDTVINIYGSPDLGGGSGVIDGAINFQSNDAQRWRGHFANTNHGNAPNLAIAAYTVLDVSEDHGSGFGAFAGGPR